MFNPSCSQRHRDLRERLAQAVTSVFAACCGCILHMDWAAGCAVTLPGATYASCETTLLAHWCKFGSYNVNILQKKSLTFDWFNKFCLEKAVWLPWELLVSLTIRKCTYSDTKEHKAVWTHWNVWVSTGLGCCGQVGTHGDTQRWARA